MQRTKILLQKIKYRLAKFIFGANWYYLSDVDRFHIAIAFYEREEARKQVEQEHGLNEKIFKKLKSARKANFNFRAEVENIYSQPLPPLQFDIEQLYLIMWRFFPRVMSSVKPDPTPNDYLDLITNFLRESAIKYLEIAKESQKEEDLPKTNEETKLSIV